MRLEQRTRLAHTAGPNFMGGWLNIRQCDTDRPYEEIASYVEVGDCVRVREGWVLICGPFKEAVAFEHRFNVGARP